MTKEKEIIKKCYENKYSTQKYENSNLKNTYEKVVIDSINEALQQEREKIMSFIEKYKCYGVNKIAMIDIRNFVLKPNLKKQLKNKER